MPSEPVQKGKTRKVIIEIKGPVSKEQLVEFHKELRALARTVRGTVVAKRRPRKSS
jgi:hypothetical protein